MSPTTLGLLSAVYKLGRAPTKKDFEKLGAAKVVAAFAQTLPWHRKLKRDANLSERVKRVESTLTLKEKDVARDHLYAVTLLNRIRGSYSAYTSNGEEESPALRAIRIFFERLPFPQKNIHPDPFPDQAPKKYDLFRYLSEMQAFSTTLEQQIIKASELIFKILDPQTTSIELSFDEIVNLSITYDFRPPCNASWKALIADWNPGKQLSDRLATVLKHRFSYKEGKIVVKFENVESIHILTLHKFLIKKTIKAIFVNSFGIVEELQNIPKDLYDRLEKAFLQSESLRRTFYYYCDLCSKVPADDARLKSFYDNIERTSTDKVLKTFIWLMRNFMAWPIRELLDKETQIKLFSHLYFVPHNDRNRFYEQATDKAIVDLGLAALHHIREHSGWKFPLDHQLLFLNILMSTLENTHLPFLSEKEYAPFFASFEQPKDEKAMDAFVKRLVALVDFYNKDKPEKISFIRFLETLKETDEGIRDHFYKEIETLTPTLEVLSLKHLQGHLLLDKSLKAILKTLEAIEKTCGSKIPASSFVDAASQLLLADVKKIHSLGTDLQIVGPAVKAIRAATESDNLTLQFVTTCISFAKLRFVKEKKSDLQQLFTAFFYNPDGQNDFIHSFESKKKYGTHFNESFLPNFLEEVRHRTKGTQLLETLNAFNHLVEKLGLNIAPKMQLIWLTKLTCYKEPMQLANFFVRLAEHQQSKITQDGLLYFLKNNTKTFCIPRIEKCVLATNLPFKNSVGVAKRIMAFLEIPPYGYSIEKLNKFLQLIGSKFSFLPSKYTSFDVPEFLDKVGVPNLRRHSYADPHRTQNITPDEDVFLRAVKNYCSSNFLNKIITEIRYKFLQSHEEITPSQWLDIYSEFPECSNGESSNSFIEDTVRTLPNSIFKKIQKLPLETHHKFLLSGLYYSDRYKSGFPPESWKLYRPFLDAIKTKISKKTYFRLLFDPEKPPVEDRFIKALIDEKDPSVITTFNEKARDTEALNRAIGILDKAKIPISLQLLTILIETDAIEEFSVLLPHFLSTPKAGESERDKLCKAYHKAQKVAVSSFEQKALNNTPIQQAMAALSALEQAFSFTIPRENRLGWISKLLHYSDPETIASLFIKALAPKIREGDSFEPVIKNILEFSRNHPSFDSPSILARFQLIDFDYLTPPDLEYRLNQLIKKTVPSAQQIEQFFQKVGIENGMHPNNDRTVLEALNRFYDVKVNAELIEKQAEEIAEKLNLQLQPTDWFEIYAYFPLLKKVLKEIPQLSVFKLSNVHRLLLVARRLEREKDVSWAPRVQFIKGIETIIRSPLPSDYSFPFLFLDTINKGGEKQLQTILEAVVSAQKNMETSEAFFVLPMIQSIENISPIVAEHLAMFWTEIYIGKYYHTTIRQLLINLLRITVTPSPPDDTTTFFPEKFDPKAPNQGLLQWAEPAPFGLGFAHRWETPGDQIHLIIDLFHEGASQQIEAMIKVPQNTRTEEFLTELQKMMYHLGPELPRVMIDFETKKITETFKDDISEYLFWAKFFPNKLPQKPSQWTGQLFSFVKQLKLGLRKGLQKLVSGKAEPINTEGHPFKTFLGCIEDKTEVSKLKLKGTNVFVHYKPKKTKNGIIHVVTLDNPQKKRITTYKYPADLSQEQLLPLLSWQLKRLL